MKRRSTTDKRFRVLVVDDHARARESIADVLRAAGYDVAACASASEALPRLAAELFDVVVTDLQMPGMNGLDFIREIERRRFDAQVLMITAHGSVSSAVEAMRLGAFDYIEKPFDASALERSVAQACERRRLYRQETGSGEQGVQCHAPNSLTPCSTPHAPSPMIGSSPAMAALRRRIAQVAATDETVLILGESGTGKELVARSIHALSRRSRGPLVSLNCPVLSSQLTESELFGHKRGAFTGAEANRTGRFEAAQGGSILLDEITEIDPGLQSKLLRVLQERTLEPVGSSETVSVDVRVLATSNRDLPTEIAAGRFRADLYYRLAVVPIDVPSLRERPGDVLELADHFLEHAAHRLKRGPFTLEDAARELLVAYQWPGNVRELQNIITRACVLNQGQPIRADQIGPWLGGAGRDGAAAPLSAAVGALPMGLTLDEVERQIIVATLERFDGHRAKTAAALGIGVRTLSGKLRAYGFAPRERDFAEAG
jgi:DNA-binding NtrC family response regulator